MTLAAPFSLEVAAGWANAARRRSFNRLRKDPNYKGPIIIAEGDSWFCYPKEFPLTPPDSPKDLILWLQEEFAVLDVAVPGALARQYRDQFFGVQGPGGLHMELQTHKPDILLLSGGGNDLLGDLEAHLPRGDRPLEQYLAGGFRRVMNGVIEDLEWVARQSVKTVTTKDLAIVLNGYDEAVPGGGKGGDWLRGPMTRLGIPRAKHVPLVDLMIKRFNGELKDLVRRLQRDFGGPPARFAVADTVGVTGVNRWYNEIHPDSEGFRDVAKRFRQAILQAMPLVA
jgi:metacaspase-1